MPVMQALAAWSATALRSRGSPVGCRSLSLVRFAAAVRSIVDCQCVIGQFSLFSWTTDGTLTKSATKTVLFQYSNVPISGAGAEPVRCFVTPCLPLLTLQLPLHAHGPCCSWTSDCHTRQRDATRLLLRFFGKYPAMDIRPLLPECHGSEIIFDWSRKF